MLGTMWPLLASKSHMVPSIVRLRREGGGARAGVGGGVALLTPRNTGITVRGATVRLERIVSGQEAGSGAVTVAALCLG